MELAFRVFATGAIFINAGLLILSPYVLVLLIKALRIYIKENS